MSKGSTEKLQRNIALSSSNLHQANSKLLSRYTQPTKQEKGGIQEILSFIQSNARMKSLQKKESSYNKANNQKQLEAVDLKNKVLEKSSSFKSRPLKRQESDKVKFHQIFINHREQALNNIKRSSKLNENVKTISKQYEKLLKFEHGEPLKQMNDKTQIQFTKENYMEAIQFLESQNSFGLNANKNDLDFYDIQIPVQLPSLETAAVMISGAKTNISPSLPPNYKNFKDLNFKELLLRAKAGLNSEDIQKQAHMSFFLGQLCTQKKKHKEALKFFRRFLGFAKIMEDRFGMSVGANRVGISYYNCGDLEKSITFHNENLKLSSQNNCFIGFYNIGICYRKLNKLQNALEYFESALSWSQQKGQEESQCIALGQIAVTFQSMELFQQSVQKFEQSLLICDRIKKKNLRMNNLLYLLRITSMLKLKSEQQLLKIAQQAFESAKELGQISKLNVLRSNIGILKGANQFYNSKNFSSQVNEIEDLNQ